MSLENKEDDFSPKLKSNLHQPTQKPIKKSSTSSKNLKQVNFLSSSPKKQAKNTKLHRVRSRISNAVEKSFNQEVFTAEEDKNTSISSGEDNFESFQKTMIKKALKIKMKQKFVWRDPESLRRKMSDTQSKRVELPNILGKSNAELITLSLI